MSSITPFPPSPPATSYEPAIVDDTSISKGLVPDSTFLSRHQFPPNFVFGAGSAAIQVEGAADEGGRGKSIWDTFCEKKFALTDDEGWLGLKRGNNQYHMYETDARLLKDLGLDAYRFSMSWSRIMPNGRPGKANEGVSKAGVAYYNNLINALKARGIEPYVTLFHWDLPQTLDDKYGGFLSERIREDFKNYAEFCFKEFGDRVKHWSTMNEPYIFAWGGYALGTMAPGHGAPQIKIKSDTKKISHRNAIGASSKFFDQIEHFLTENVTRWIRICDNILKQDAPHYDSAAVEPYTVGHNMLLAHADAYNLYKNKYKASQGGECGITLCSHWFQALDENSSDDKNAAQRQLDFMLGWMMKPLTAGEYPKIMTEYVKDRLPSFKENDAKSLINSFDFIGMNYYTAYRVKDAPELANDPPHFVNDPRGKKYPLGSKSTSAWIYVYEQGLQKLMKEINSYGKQGEKIGIIVTENGIDRKGDDPNLSLVDYLSDEMRIDYHHGHLYYLLQAINRDKINVKGYFSWSFLDSFEFTNGNQRFGNCYVDYDNGFKRIPKLSAAWYKFFLQSEIPTENAQELNARGGKRKGENIEQGDPKRANNGVSGNGIANTANNGVSGNAIAN